LCRHLIGYYITMYDNHMYLCYFATLNRKCLIRVVSTFGNIKLTAEMG